MKIHGARLHADYWRTKYSSCPIVRLDGVEQSHVIMADDVLGLVEAMVYMDGKPVRENGRFKSDLRTGQVEIVGERHAWIKVS